MLKDFVDILAKSVDVLTKLKRTHKEKWCSRLLHAHFLLQKFLEELRRFHDILSYYSKKPEPDVKEVVDDLEQLRLHPRSDFLRVPWVVKKSVYVRKMPEPVPGTLFTNLCLKYVEREDGIIVRYDEDRWTPGETPPQDGIIVVDQALQSALSKSGGQLDQARVLTAREYLLYLLELRLARLLDRLRDVVDGWANQLHIWDDLLSMEENKLIVLDPELHQSLNAALRLEGQFYSNLMVHCEAWINTENDVLTISDTFFGRDNRMTVPLRKRDEAVHFLNDLSSYIDQLEAHAHKLARFISEKFEMEEILGA